ncbi:MAG TPA: molybdopterin-dependent oxidoreductase [Chloroflexota bacterium]|jgi:DMSO/TMAO reductase YedYZ molybdopterin-dependent catalytic subunit
MDRRTLLRRAGLASAGLLLGGGAALRGLDLLARQDLSLAYARGLLQDVDLPGITPAITPNDRFYTVSKNTFGDPELDGNRWRLRVTGSVANQLDLDLNAIRGIGSVQQYQTLECIDNEVGGDLISTAQWTGARLADMLTQAGPGGSARRVVFRCEDGYSDSIPLEKAMEPTTLLAYEMNGQPLPQKHGFPVRVLSPNLYGIKNPKWVTEIQVIDGDYRGFWQQRGWTNEGIIKTMSRIDVPANGSTVAGGYQRIGGLAFAGSRGISSVEVSADGGTSWTAATLAPALSNMTWVLWTSDWLPQGPLQVLAVRATDGAGQPQPTQVAASLPDGVSGIQRVTVRVS